MKFSSNNRVNLSLASNPFPGTRSTWRSYPTSRPSLCRPFVCTPALLLPKSYTCVLSPSLSIVIGSLILFSIVSGCLSHRPVKALHILCPHWGPFRPPSKRSVTVVPLNARLPISRQKVCSIPSINIWIAFWTNKNSETSVMKQCYEMIKVEMIPLNWILGRGFQFRDSIGVS